MFAFQQSTHSMSHGRLGKSERVAQLATHFEPFASGVAIAKVVGRQSTQCPSFVRSDAQYNCGRFDRSPGRYDQNKITAGPSPKLR